MEQFVGFLRALSAERVRFVLIGVAGANYYAQAASVIFTTQDYDFFLPLDASNLLRAIRACESLGLTLWSGHEPLDSPRDLWLAERIVERPALVRARDDRGLEVDLTLTMAGFDFEAVWASHRAFTVNDIEIPVASLLHIVQSKAKAARDKDRLFLATHAEALEQLLGKRS